MIVKDINHYAGDTYDAILGIDGYVPGPDDVIKFGIKETKEDETCIVEKTIPYDTMRLHLDTSDTQNMVGTYFYDAQITFTDDDDIEHTVTFIRGKFKVIKDVVR